MATRNANDALLLFFESLADEFEKPERDFREPLIPDTQRISERKISDADDTILNEIYDKAYGMTGGDSTYTEKTELRAYCQACLDERWPELSCDYDEAVRWLREALGLPDEL